MHLNTSQYASAFHHFRSAAGVGGGVGGDDGGGVGVGVGVGVVCVVCVGFWC